MDHAPSLRSFGWVLLTVIAVALSSAEPLSAQVTSGPAILQDLKSFGTIGTVLHVAAHPDDENTQLITYLARGRGYRAAYLSVTRGDGGQNALGPQLFEELGVARTQELLAARRLDGGRQFFTRAIDFGYSKDVNETLRTWNHNEMIGDVVRVIRTFRPDVIVTRFSTQPAPGQHGQHTASAVLAGEAFKLAGDPKAYPEQLVGDITPWQPKRLVLNAGFGGGRGGAANTPNVVQVDIGGNDPVSGESFAAIANRSRAMHRTQFDLSGGGRGGGGARGGAAGAAGAAQPNFQSFQHLDGEPATKDLMDGVDTTWARVTGGAEVAKLVDEAIAKFDSQNLSANIPALLAIRAKAIALPKDSVVKDKLAQLDRIVAACLGLTVQTSIAQAEVVAGEKLSMRHSASIQANIPVRWTAVRYPLTSQSLTQPIDLKPNSAADRYSDQTIPIATAPTTPYWLAQPGTAGMFRVDNQSLIGRPESPPVFPVEFVFDVGGQTIVIPDEPMQPAEPGKGMARHLDVIPPVSLHFLSQVSLFKPGGEPTRPVELEIIPSRADVHGTIQLDVPAGWKVEPASSEFAISAGQSSRVTFNVTAPAQPAKAVFGAHVVINGKSFNNDRTEVRYDHFPLQLLQPPAKLNAVSVDLQKRGTQIGYLHGAGDDVSECLNQMGYTVTHLTGDDLKADTLKKFDTVVLGIRIFDTAGPALIANLPELLAYVEQGGNLIIQYNRQDLDRQNPGTFGPFRIQQSGQRVTDENATMTFLAPEHPVLNTPNKITEKDFDGWVQRRGIYFPSQWDDRFTPIFAANDPGEQPLQGGLLVAKYGKGNLVYTGLVFFRELPEGVPGAYRLFANLISLGK